MLASAIGTTQIHPLDRAFYNRDPRPVARDLLGKVLVRQDPDSLLTARIVEVEAYLGEKDPAAHSAVGKTARNAVLFGPPGYAYVYFIYGNHYCLNVSCEPDGKAGGILFRALEPITGVAAMAQAREIEIPGDDFDGSAARDRALRQLTSGPGRLAEAFGITRARDNGRDLTSVSSSLWIGDDEYRVRKIVATPRIGFIKAVDKPLRYFVAGNPFISGPKLLGRISGSHE